MPKAFHVRGDDVIVHAELELADGVKPVWSLYCFEGERLVAAITFESEADALEHCRTRVEACA